MIIKKIGTVFEYEGVVYSIGEPVIATEKSKYQGLFGIITEIRDGLDKETENGTPDIYCSFNPPVLKSDRDRIEKNFSELYGKPKGIEDISLDCVIMAPEMIQPLSAINKDNFTLPVFLLEEDWAVNDEYGHNVALFTDFIDAKRELCKILFEEMRDGCIPLWKDRDDFIVDETDLSYECYLDNDYLENHYSVSIQRNAILISNSTLNDIRSRMEQSEKFVPDCFRPEPFASSLCVGNGEKKYDDCSLYSDTKNEGGYE